jgi:hypothetical protein
VPDPDLAQARAPPGRFRFQLHWKELRVQLLGAVLGGSFVLASLVVGVRLVRLSITTHRSPELLIGAGLLLLGVLGYPLMTVARKAQALDEIVRTVIAMTSGACLALGALLLTLFVRRVFHATSTSGRIAVGLYGAALAGLFVWQSTTPGWWPWLTEQRGVWVGARWLFLVPISWGGFEALRYWGMLRRRARLGLADPVVTDRFRLYGIAMLAGLAANAGTVVCQMLGIEVVGTPIGAVVVSPASIAAVSLWLAFLPPEAYRARIRAAAAAHAAEAA